MVCIIVLSCKALLSALLSALCRAEVDTERGDGGEGKVDARADNGKQVLRLYERKEPAK